MIRILGIDPGSNATGWGVIERAGGDVIHVAHGVLRCREGVPLAGRLAALRAGLAEVVVRQRPAQAAVERVFCAVNPRAALVLGQARGAALVALAEAGLPVHEYAPAEIKRAVAGTGAADKRQIQAMVRRLLGLEARPPQDAADALAAALCHAYAGRLMGLGRGARGRPRRRAGGWVVRSAR